MLTLPGPLCGSPARTAALTSLLVLTTAALVVGLVRPSAAAGPAMPRLRSDRLDVRFGTDGSIQSLKIVGDRFPTEYVMNPTSAPEQAAEPDPKRRQWLGNLMFSYALGTGPVTTTGVGDRPWRTAWTTASADGRRVRATADGVQVSFAGSKAANGIRDFRLAQRFSFDRDGSLVWRQTVTNTSGRPLTIGDWGVPVPGNELWGGGDRIYETRVLTRSSITGDGSYLQLGRPSGIGPSLLVAPDPATGTRWEYQDRWRTEEVGNTSWAWNQSQESSNIKGLNVYYLHSAAIARTGRGYLPSTSLRLSPGASRTYAIRVTTVPDEAGVARALHDLGLPDVAVVPGMVVPYDQPARVAVRVRGTVLGLTARPDDVLRLPGVAAPVVTRDGVGGGYQRFRIRFDRSHLGVTRLSVRYRTPAGAVRTAVLQMRVVDRTQDLLARHAAFLVDRQQWTAKDGIGRDDVRYATFDDWLMNAAGGALPSATKPPRARTGWYGEWGVGDDWGLTKAQFLAAFNERVPRAEQVRALDSYLHDAVWHNLMGNRPGSGRPSYLVPNWWDPERGGRESDITYRGYAYAHLWNTFVSMYRIADENPRLVRYRHPARWYLETAAGILREYFDGPVGWNLDTGVMGEQTTPAVLAALRAEHLDRQADDLEDRYVAKFGRFAANTYPYGSEYAYDNTGEESVYTLARMAAADGRSQAKALAMMRQIVTKTRAVRGRNPVWFQYAVPVTNTGENTWQFQYTIALAGVALDDWINGVTPAGRGALTAAERASLQQLNYGAKLGGLNLVNSGEISAHPDNLGAAAWTYQAERGVLGTNGWGGGPTVVPLNGYRGMSGESGLMLWGILQYLSADVVTDDPIFGTVGYGAEVTRGGGTTTVRPRDGLGRRLNLVTAGLSVALGSDRYRKATVLDGNRGLSLHLDNATGRPHDARLTVSGLANGSYQLLVDGSPQGTVRAAQDAASPLRRAVPVRARLDAGRDAVVELRPTSAAPNRPPGVAVRADRATLTLGVDDVMLRAVVSDDGAGAPDGRVTTTWSTVSVPPGARVTVREQSASRFRAGLDTPGRYTFRVAADDGLWRTVREVRVQARPPAPAPKTLVQLPFPAPDGAGPRRSTPDTSGNRNHLRLDGDARVVRAGTGSVLRLGPSQSAQARLPDGALTVPGPLTVSLWVRPRTALPKADVPLVSSNRNAQEFIGLFASERENGTVTVMAPDPADLGTWDMVTTTYRLAPGRWTHLRATLAPDAAQHRMTVRLYADGRLIGSDARFRLTPAMLGRQARALVGRWSGEATHFDGDLDDVRVEGGLVTADPPDRTSSK